MTEYPDISDVVVCKVTKVLDYGVFVELFEYEGVQGFVHISQVASSWIKNIRNHVKENQIRAGQVTSVDHNKKQVDLSFNKVSPRVQRTKIEEWKQLKRVQKLIDVLAKSQKIDFETAWGETAGKLLEKHESLYDAFQDILINEEEAVQGIDKKWVKPLVQLVKDNMEVQKKVIKGSLSLSCPASNGIEVIKEALTEAEKSVKKAEAEIYYIGSGKYGVSVSSLDFKISENALKQLTDTAINVIKKNKGQGSFVRADDVN